MERQGKTTAHRPVIRKTLPAQDAAKLLQSSFTWRHSYGPHRITLDDVSTAAATGNNFTHGHDLQGRPVIYLIKRGHPGNDLDNVRLLVYNMELAARCTPPGVDKYCVVIDLAGYSRANATPLSVSRMTLDILTNQYPERVCDWGCVEFVLIADLVLIICCRVPHTNILRVSCPYASTSFVHADIMCTYVLS